MTKKQLEALRERESLGHNVMTKCESTGQYHTKQNTIVYNNDGSFSIVSKRTHMRKQK